MAMTMKVDGLDEIGAMLNRLGARAEGVAARALYDGAGVMANEYADAVNSIKTDRFRYAFNGQKRSVSPEEKEALQGKIGIAKFDRNGSEVGTAVGISGAGYAEIAGKQRAVRKIANAINSGTSFMEKQPVFRKAVRTAAGPASAAIVAKADELFNQIINDGGK